MDKATRQEYAARAIAAQNHPANWNVDITSFVHLAQTEAQVRAHVEFYEARATSGVHALMLPLASALFAAYARNSGNNPEEHFDRDAAEQWMAQALGECGVYELIEAGNRVIAAFRAIGNNKAPATPAALRIDAEQAILALDAALARVQGGAA